MATNLSVIRNADGRLELFRTNAQNVIFHRWQTAINNGWSEETRLGITELATSFEVAMNLDGRLELFYVGTDGNFYHKAQLNAGSDQWEVESKLSQAPEETIGMPFKIHTYKIGRNRTGRVGKDIDGRLELFYIDSVTALLFHKRQTAPNAQTWSIETIIPVNLTPRINNIAVGQNRDGRLELFCTVEGSNILIHRSQKAPDSAQWNFEEIFNFNDKALEMAVGQNSDGRLELFYTGTDLESHIYHRWQTAPKNEWTDEVILGNNDSAIALATGRNQDRRLELFYIGTNGDLYHKWQLEIDGEWSAEAKFDNPESVHQIAVGNNEDDRLELIYSTVNGNLFHTWQVVPNGEWSASQQF